MRLINANTLMLEEFGDPSIGRVSEEVPLPQQVPRYAILSHTWSSKHDEVSFQEMCDRQTAESKPGFAKIRLTCEEALRQNLNYVWIDTCCIDKSSSAELSEAIELMYKWYQYSDACYAYLSDVVQLPSGARLQLNLQLPNSRWFTRGWTLQELLAPERVLFFPAEWTFLGSKHELCHLISQTTSIPANYLKKTESISTASVAQRMGWSSTRQTTRLEDIAYCLLGIFDVNMPLLYGEGKKAFRRLQQEIIKSQEDHTIFAWELLPAQRDYRRSDRISCLAESPENFKHSNFVACLTRHVWDPLVVTSRGLQVQLPIWTPKGNSGPRILLNCRKQGDFFNLLTLPLVHDGYNPASRTYARDRHRDIMSVVADGWDSAEKQSASRIFLSVDLGEDTEMRPKEPSYPVLIRSLPQDFSIEQVDPPECWRKDEDYFDLPITFTEDLNTIVVIFQRGFFKSC